MLTTLTALTPMKLTPMTHMPPTRFRDTAWRTAASGTVLPQIGPRNLGQRLTKVPFVLRSASCLSLVRTCDNVYTYAPRYGVVAASSLPGSSLTQQTQHGEYVTRFQRVVFRVDLEPRPSRGHDTGARQAGRCEPEQAECCGTLSRKTPYHFQARRTLCLCLTERDRKRGVGRAAHAHTHTHTHTHTESHTHTCTRGRAHAQTYIHTLFHTPFMCVQNICKAFTKLFQREGIHDDLRQSLLCPERGHAQVLEE